MKQRRDVRWLFCTAFPKASIFLITLPFVFLLRIIRPIIWIRFIPVSERIGHGLANIDFYLSGQRAGLYPSKAKDIFYPDRPWKINRQMVKMWKRIIPLFDFVYWMVWANWGNPLFAPHYYDPPNAGRDIHGLSNDTPPPVSFSRNEEDRGAVLLRDMGIPPGSPIVCFHARDSAFLRSFNPTGDWEYQGHRDVDIDSYVPAIKELAARGYYCIRMGRVVNKSFTWEDSRVIDYAAGPCRSDFADLYLISRCHFYIGSACGIDGVAGFFRKPQLVSNLIPLYYVSSWSQNFLNIFKKLWLVKEKRFLKFREILGSEVGRFMEAGQYKKYGLEVVNNTPEEILDAVIEREDRMRGRWKTNDEYESLQRRFWALFRPDDIHHVFNARVGSMFLMQNKDLLG